MERAREVLAHLRPVDCAGHRDSPNDVVIVCAVRTPIGKAKRGSFAHTPADDLLAAALKGVIQRTGIDPKVIGDISVGNVLADQSAFMARIGQFLAGIPETVPISTVNRQCSSGLQAVMNIADAIRAGHIDVGIGAGVESMSAKAMGDAAPAINPRIFDHDAARACLTPMGVTSENVAEQFNVTREKQDAFSVRSHAKAAAAQQQNLYLEELIPTEAVNKNEAGEETGRTLVSKDDGVRGGTTLADLGKLKPAFKKDGTTTAGNSSQVSDGAAAVLLASRAAAQRLGLPVLAVIRSYAVVGVPPDIMGIGPAVAIPKAVKDAGLKLDDISIFEINEAFASQAVYCVEKLNIPLEKVNPKGGAIALGHPLGCTGARQIATLLPELWRRGGGLGVVSMCIGTGMGAAAVIEVPRT